MKQIYLKLSFLLFLFIGLYSTSYGQDAGVTTLLSPKSLTCGANSGQVTAIVYNYGSTTLSNIPCVAKISGSLSATLLDTLKKTIASGKQDTITFKTTINTYSGGTFNFKVYSNLSGDKSRSNDTLTLSLKILAFPNNPTVTNGTSCGSGLVKLKAVSTSAGSKTYWFPSSSSNVVIAKGDSFIPYLGASATYYASSYQLTGPLKDSTTFTGGNSQTGNMFDVYVNKTVTIDSFDVSPNSSGSDSIEFFYKSGSYVGYSGSASAWTFGGKCAINSSSSGAGSIARAVMGSVTLQAGNYYGIYIHLKSTNYLNYTNSSTTPATDTFRSADMKISWGLGVAGTFGSTFSPRNWNGKIYYSIPACNSSRVAVTATVSPPVKGIALSQNKTSKGVYNTGSSISPDEICVADSLKYDLSAPSNFLNADYGTKWKLTYSMKTAKNTSTTNFIVNNPSSSAKGSLWFLPKSGDADSVYILTVKATNLVSGCDSIFTRYVHVNQIPSPQFTVGNVCFGQPLSIKNTSTPAGKIKFNWDFGNGDTSTAVAPPYKYKGAATNTIILTTSNAACQVSLSKSVTIYIAPYGSNLQKGTPFRGQMNTGDVIDPDNVCLNDTNTYAITAPKGLSNSDYGTKWIINNLTFATVFGTSIKDTAFKKPTSSKSATFSFFPSKFTDSVFILKFYVRTLPGSCDSLVYRYIHIRVKPTASFTAINACAGSPVTFKDGSTIKISSVTNWAWDFGDGLTSNAQNPAHVYAKPNSYKVTLTAISDAGCSNAVSGTVIQYPRATVKFGQTLTCNGYFSSFTDSSKIATGSISSWKWNFGDGSNATGQYPAHYFAKSGFYTVKLVTTSDNGCKDSFSRKERIMPKPVANYTYQNECVGTIIYFANNSVDSSLKTTYLWNYGDGTTSTSVLGTHTFTKNGSYNMSLVAKSGNGCSDTFKTVVKPYIKPVLNFSVKPSCAGAPVVCSDSSNSGTGSILTWSYSDGGSDQTVNLIQTHTFAKAGTYKITLSITNAGGCTDTLSKFVNIINFPHASFSALAACVGFPNNFTNNSTSTTSATYNWNFGDNSAISHLTTPNHIYKKDGTYATVLTVINNIGCKDSSTINVTVYPKPAVPLWVRKQDHYTVTLIPNDTTQAKYLWYFGTGDSSAKKKPTYTYPTADAKYPVKLTVTSTHGCINTNTDTVYTGKLNGIAENQNTFNGVSVFPNPFEGVTHISYNLEGSHHVSISVSDAQGKQVYVLKDGKFPTGNYTETLDASKANLGAGIYFIKMLVDDKIFATRIVNLK